MSQESLDIPTEWWFDWSRRSVFQPIDAKSTEPMPFDCEHIVDSGLGWLISMEK